MFVPFWTDAPLSSPLHAILYMRTLLARIRIPVSRHIAFADSPLAHFVNDLFLVDVSVYLPIQQSADDPL